MGTRNLTVVVKNGEYKIAKYCQWDGYPEGQGIDVLKFARKLLNADCRKVFEEKVDAIVPATQEYIDSLNEKIDKGEYSNWTQVFPEFSRDTGAEILDIVLERYNAQNECDYYGV